MMDIGWMEKLVADTPGNVGRRYRMLKAPTAIQYLGVRYVAVSDGHAVIAIPDAGLAGEVEEASSRVVMKFASEFELRVDHKVSLKRLKEFCGPPEHRTTCQMCDGKGESEPCPHCGHTETCPHCDGDPFFIPAPRRAHIGGLQFDRNLIARFLEGVPDDEEACVRFSEEMMLISEYSFSASRWFAIFMGMRRDDGASWPEFRIDEEAA